MTWPILIIEDDADVCDGLVQVLTARGYRVTATSNGADGLAWLNKGGQPAVIVLDLMMPVMDGRKFIEHLAEDPRLIKIPVVVLTAQPHMAVGLDTKVETILHKPLPLRRLLDTIEAICHGARSTREMAALRAATAPTPALGVEAAAPAVEVVGSGDKPGPGGRSL